MVPFIIIFGLRLLEESFKSKKYFFLIFQKYYFFKSVLTLFKNNFVKKIFNMKNSKFFSLQLLFHG